MLEVAYEYGKAQEESADPILDLVKHIEGYETTYEIIFNIDDKTLDFSRAKKFSTEHPEKYLYITEKGNVPYYSPTTVELGNITGVVRKTDKNKKTEESGKKTIIGCLNKLIHNIDFKDKIDLKSIIPEIEKIFYNEINILTENKEIKILALKNKYYEEILKIEGKQNLYTIGFIKDEKRFLLAELREYKEFLTKHKLGTEKKKNNLKENLKICDFCGEEKEMVNNLGQSDPYKLASLKMFTSTFAKGFYKLDSSEENLYKTIRCCKNCIKKIQQVDSNLSTNHYIDQLKQISAGKKTNTKPVNIYLFLHRITGKHIAKDDLEEIIYIVNILFKEISFDGKLKMLTDIKNNLYIEEIEDIVIDLFFNIGSQQKNQVIHEARNISVYNISEMLKKLSYLTEARRILMPSSVKFFNLRYMFELISLFNYKVSVEVIKSFFHKKVPLTDLVLKGMLKHIRSAAYNSFPEKLGYMYLPLTLDLSLMFSFIALLNMEDFKMETITKDLVLEKFESKQDKKTKLRAKPIRSFVEKVYADISLPEISLMEIGEIIHDISSELYKHGKEKREKIFLAKIDYTGMQNKDIEKLLVFINGKISQYHTDLKYITGTLAEKLNRITIETNNNTFDKNKSVLRIVDGYNLKKRISILAGTLNKEEEK